MHIKFLFSILCLFLLATTISIPSSAQYSAGLITALQTKGWKILDKSEEVRKLSGLPPYGNLTRYVQIVNYKFKKGKPNQQKSTVSSIH